MAKSEGDYSGLGGIGRLAAHLGTFVVISSLAGLLIAGLVLPVSATVGLAAKSASDNFESLPDDFQTPTLPQRSTILAADGSVIATTWSEDLHGNRVVVPWSQISSAMPEAIVSIEDQRFYQHGGIDLKGTLRALVNDSSGGSLQGGSSIAQQYVKNVLEVEAGANTAAQQSAIADTLSRKITELKYAIAVEQQMSKQELLDRYLNIVYFGNDAYGVETAAERYFSTTSAKLTVTQAALLAAIVNSPTMYDPFLHPKEALARRNIVIADMASPSLHYITAAQAAAYEKMPLGLKPTTPQDGCITAKASAAFFCNYVYETFMQSSAYGATTAARKAMWNEGGLTITTTLDPKNETSADSAIGSRVYATDKVGSALVEVTPGTGAIVAMAQSKRMGSGSGETYLNLTTDTSHNGTTGFQAGSSFKIFVGLAALEQGISPSSQIDALHQIDDTSVNFASCQNGVNSTVPWQEGSTPYTPSNDDSTNGPVDMIYGFAMSVNTYFLRLEEKTGLCQPATIAASMGVTQDNDSGNGKALLQIPSFTLGTNNITPVEMAEAYATLASGGTYCKPYAITGVTDSSGKQYAAQSKQCTKVLDTNTVNELTYMLQGVVKWGTAAGAVTLDGRDVAGKTGTTDGGVATWFDGYTPQLATAVWTGYINWNTTTKMENIKIGPKYFSGQVFGASISAPIFNDAMTGALSGVAAESFTAPTGFDNSGSSQNQGTGTSTTGGATGATTGGTTGGTTNGNGNQNGNGGSTGLFGGIF
ncbi:penicillin-binding protein [Actinospica sp. MGRD01-02]|uniref:Penicillin-binding protein n=1 Tax=Actinospica acidithermotolerans TaxID=2828514 RepID=A0A941E901_9ACTN|nr:transglycosylase domain-containing protein [Actinospica acidithermotolerans]MBR7826128.1 penicillin-binding protein [Actinospica acidithermotolerans]